MYMSTNGPDPLSTSTSQQQITRQNPYSTRCVAALVVLEDGYALDGLCAEHGIPKADLCCTEASGTQSHASELFSMFHGVTGSAPTL